MSPRGLGSFIAMPMVGLLVAKTDPRKLLGIGLVGAALSVYGVAALNLGIADWDIFWPQFFQALSMGLVFGPLTTVTMSQIPGQELGTATSILNLMRNLGGGIGIASVATMLSRNTQTQYNIMGAHVSTFDMHTRMLLDQIRTGLMSRGIDFATATNAAYAQLSGIVSKQAVMVAFVQLFRILALVFAVVVPLVFLMKQPHSKQTVS